MTAAATGGRLAGFPPGFLWGTATAAYQVEGAWDGDGRGPCVWDTFVRLPGRVEGGDTGDLACDHYHRWHDDIGLMARLGLNTYRFSVSWSRVLPEGTGRVNQAGLDFYRRLVDALLERDITPALTLYHWDLPEELQRHGGWADRDTAAAFAAYAEVVANALGDRVPLWITHNEPSLHAIVGHAVGRHAPGVRDWRTGHQVAHHLLVSHGWAVEVLRAGTTGKVGISLALEPAVPSTDSAEDAAAARRHDDHLNAWYLDPLFRARYPDALWAWLAARGLTPEVGFDDLATIAAPIDFLGVNFYHRRVTCHDRDGGPLELREVPAGGTTTAMGWEVRAQSLYDMLTAVSREYGPCEVYVTENGAAYDDRVIGGRVHDVERVAYLAQHMRAARDALSDGVPLRGYFVWSLLDNFQWDSGYAKRFGVIHVDFQTQCRTVKDSGWFLRDVATSNGVPLGPAITANVAPGTDGPAPAVPSLTEASS